MTTYSETVSIPGLKESTAVGAYTSRKVPFYLQTATATGTLSSSAVTFTGLDLRPYWVTESPQNTVYALDVSGASSGNFRLRVGSDSTFNQAYNVSAANLQTALQALPSVGSGNATVSLSAGVYTITFAGSLARTNQTLELLAGSPDLNVAGTLTKTTAGTPGGSVVFQIQPVAS